MLAALGILKSICWADAMPIASNYAATIIENFFII